MAHDRGAQMKVRIAVSPGTGSVDPGDLAPFLDGLEANGFDTVWLSDVPMAGTVDPFLGLAFAAARTTRLKLGANIVPFGVSPYVLAKDLAQLDRLTAGRLLISLVPGLDQPGEREALMIGGRHRGRDLDLLIPMLRQWWAGEAVDHRSAWFECTELRLPVQPVQQPLEIWLGGSGPAALERAGRLADGWLGANVTPHEAGIAVRRIHEEAGRAGRAIDPEHVGLSIPYARTAPDEEILRRLASRRPDRQLEDIVPVGRGDLRRLLTALIDHGVSKFVLRPLAAEIDWPDELAWLADAALPLQT